MKGVAFIWTNFQECFVLSWVEMGLAVLKKNISKCCQYIYAISLLSPIWNMAWPFISRNFHSHHSKMDLLRQVGVKLTFKCWWLFCFLIYLSIYSYTGDQHVYSLGIWQSPAKRGVALQMNKIESPSPGDAFCQVWFKFTQWFWRRRWTCEKFTDNWR